MTSIQRHVHHGLYAATLLAVTTAPAFGAGFGLLEQSGSGLGRSFAGSAAVTDNASVMFFNAAGLAALDSQVVAGVSGIDIDSRFHDGGSAAATGQTTLGGEGGNAGGWNTVPSAYLAWRLSPRFVFGLGLNAPFGLSTEYDSDWLGRFQAVRSEVTTVNINPAVAWKINDHVSVGVGLDQQRIDATLTSKVNVAAAVLQQVASLCASGGIPAGSCPGAQAAAVGLSGNTVVHGTDDAWGWNAGVLLNFGEATAVGVSYRSAINYHIRGDVNFTLPDSSNPYVAGIIAAAGAGQLADGPVSLDLKVPDTAIVSLSQKIADRTTLMADVSWSGWSSVPALNIVRDSGTTLSNTPERWKDTWRYALGADAQISDAWTLRVGAAFDQTPVPDSTRTPRLPDGDRTWLSAGASWQISKRFGVDAGYAHLWVKNAKLEQDNGNAQLYGVISGEQKSSIDIFALQARFVL